MILRLGRLLREVAMSRVRFSSSVYWNKRYTEGGNSGAGSYGRLALFKAEVINAFVAEQQVTSVLEFGCGDGNQLTYARYPNYVGYDVSPVAVDSCRRRFASDPSKAFFLMDDYAGMTAPLALSLDVIFHLIEDKVYESYMRRLFDASTKFVIVYSSDDEGCVVGKAPHVRHRNFTAWVAEHATDWKLEARVDNRFPFNGDLSTSSFCEFFIFARRTPRVGQG
jgi:SAM-dependent methyltransferase